MWSSQVTGKSKHCYIQQKNLKRTVRNYPFRMKQDSLTLESVLQTWQKINGILLLLTATANPRTNVGFILYIAKLYLQYVQEDAKDVMIEYMAIEKCIKRRNVATIDHCYQMSIDYPVQNITLESTNQSNLSSEVCQINTKGIIWKVVTLLQMKQSFQQYNT